MTTIKTESGYNDCMLALDYAAQSKVRSIGPREWSIALRSTTPLDTLQSSHENCYCYPLLQKCRRKLYSVPPGAQQKPLTISTLESKIPSSPLSHPN